MKQSWCDPVMMAVLFVGVALGFGAFYFLKPAKSLPTTQATEPTPSARLPTIGQMAEMSDAELGRMDIATVNLLCTPSVSGFAPVDIEKSMKTLNYMTEGVRTETARNWHRFLENPAESENSEAYFKVAMMITVLCQDFKVAYNPEKIQPDTLETLKDKTFYNDPDDVFLNGVLGNKRLGTCSSMPVLCVAVGRRLGYPLKLAAAKGHLFFRWADAKEHRNFDCTNGVSSLPDEKYRKWPFPVTDEEFEKGHYLRDFTPKEELACFLSIRAQVQAFHGDLTAAVLSQTQANVLHPKHPDLEVGLGNLMNRKAVEIGTKNVTPVTVQQLLDPDDEAEQAYNRAIRLSRNLNMPPVPPIPFIPSSAFKQR